MAVKNGNLSGDGAKLWDLRSKECVQVILSFLCHPPGNFTEQAAFIFPFHPLPGFTFSLFQKFDAVVNVKHQCGAALSPCLRYIYSQFVGLLAILIHNFLGVLPTWEPLGLFNFNSQFISIYNLQEVLPPWESLGVLVRFYIVALHFLSSSVSHSTIARFSQVWFYIVALDYSALPQLIPPHRFSFLQKTNCFQTVFASGSHQSGILAELLICFTFQPLPLLGFWGSFYTHMSLDVAKCTFCGIIYLGSAQLSVSLLNFHSWVSVASQVELKCEQLSELLRAAFSAGFLPRAPRMGKQQFSTPGGWLDPWLRWPPEVK